MAIFDPSTWFGGGNSPYGSPLPGAGANPYNPAAAFQYDPATIRRAAISNALLQAGAAMLGQGPSRTPINFGTSLGQGLSAGIQGGQQGAEQAMQRQQFAQQSAAGAQQYKAGQQALVGGNLNNQFALIKVNGIRNHFGLPALTMADLNANPDLVNSPTGSATPSAPAAPALGGVNPMAPPPAAIQPGVTGGGPEVPAGGAAPQSAPQATQGATDPYGQLQSDVNDMWDIGNYEGATKSQFDLDSMRRAASQAAGVTAATDAANAGGTGAFVKNASDMATSFTGSVPVQQYHTALNNYGPMLKAAAAMATDNTGAAENDMLNSALKIFNPEANIIRPGMTASLEDMKGIPAETAKLYQKAFGGGALTDKEKNAVIEGAKQHFYALAKDYGSTVSSLTTQANALPVPVPEQIWRRDLPPKGTTPPIGYYKSGYIYNGGDPSLPASWQKLQ